MLKLLAFNIKLKIYQYVIFFQTGLGDQEIDGIKRSEETIEIKEMTAVTGYYELDDSWINGYFCVQGLRGEGVAWKSVCVDVFMYMF